MDVRHPNQWMIIRMILRHLSCGSTTAGWWEAPDRLDIFGILEPAWAGWFACILQPSPSPEWSGHLTDAVGFHWKHQWDCIQIWYVYGFEYMTLIQYTYYSNTILLSTICVYIYRYRYTTGAIIYVDQCISKYIYIYTYCTHNCIVSIVTTTYLFWPTDFAGTLPPARCFWKTLPAVYPWLCLWKTCTPCVSWQRSQLRTQDWCNSIMKLCCDYTEVGKCPFLRILIITFKYLLEIISPIVGWCPIGTFTNPCYNPYEMVLLWCLIHSIVV